MTWIKHAWSVTRSKMHDLLYMGHVIRLLRAPERNVIDTNVWVRWERWRDGGKHRVYILNEYKEKCAANLWGWQERKKYKLRRPDMKERADRKRMSQRGGDYDWRRCCNKSNNSVTQTNVPGRWSYAWPARNNEPLHTPGEINYR